MNISDGLSGFRTGGLEKAGLPEVQTRTVQSLKQYQRSQMEATIAFQKAILKAAGYGGKIDGFY